jgi:DNA-dependent RNA polymerase auxiliary subunit epsilon
MQAEAEKRSAGVEDLIDESTNAWGMYKLFRQIREDNMYALFYEMTHDQSPFRERFTNKTKYIQAADAGEETLVAGSDADLRRIRLDGTDHYLLLTEGLDDPRATTFRYNVIRLRPNELDSDGTSRDVDHSGLRVWDIERHERAKDDLDDGDLSLADLGYNWGPDAK